MIAAVSVVLPWSTCPMVPTLTWGFDLTYASEYHRVDVQGQAARIRHWLELAATFYRNRKNTNTHTFQPSLTKA